MARAERSVRAEWIALAGTPGVGKSTAARMLPKEIARIEVGRLARRLGAGRGSGRSVVVNLRLLARRMASRPERTTVVVGSLSHRLPVDRVILLRCHPVVLERRLGRRKDAVARRQANVVAEAIDFIRVEAGALGRPIVEVDTTRTRPREVARRISQLIRRRAWPERDPTDWLRDPTVTAHLLRRTR